MKRVFALLGIVAAAAVAGLGGLLGLAPARFAELEMGAERRAAGLHRAELDIPGFHIVYLEGGQGEPLLLLHGFGADKDNWTRVARLLTAHYRVIAPDLPGFGESARPAYADYSVPAQVANVNAIAAALHLERFDLGGNSMGGDIAAAYAAVHPQQVHSLWLLAPGGVASAAPSELGGILARGGPNPLVARTPEEFEGLLRFVFVKPPFIPAGLVKVLAQRNADNYELQQRIFRQLLASPPLEQQVGGLTTPCLIVWGEQDRALSPTGAEVLHKLMPASTVRLMPQVGHLPMLEAVRQSAADYLAFRAGLR